MFVKDTAATTCYGWKGQVRNKPSDAPTLLTCSSITVKCNAMKYATGPEKPSTPEIVYYHLFKSCTNLTEVDVREGKLVVADDVQKNLSSLHKYFFKDFGMMLNR